MSLTTLVWLGCFATLAILTFRRPSWGIALYLQVFYLDPTWWWWGGSIKGLIGGRLSLTAAVILAVATLSSRPQLRRQERSILIALLLLAINATVVHLTLADSPERSARSLDLVWKNTGLLLLMITAIRDRVDWNIFIYSVLIGSLYISYELVVNDRGGFRAGRLERIVASGVNDSNYTAGFLSLAVPLAGALLLVGTRWERLLALVTLPLVCDTIVLCNSRGGFVALLAGGAWLIAFAKGKARRYAIVGLMLAVLAGTVLVRDERIVNRFLTAFAPTEERDSTARGRIEFWNAGLQMLRDHPLGLGGEAAFRSGIGRTYLRSMGVYEDRAVHNGYLDVACAWGVQGIMLYAIALYLAWRTLNKAIQHQVQRENWKASFFGVCIQASFVTQLVSAMFLSSFDGEWFFWLVAMMIGYDRLFGPESSTVPAVATTVATRLPVSCWHPEHRLDCPPNLR